MITCVFTLVCDVRVSVTRPITSSPNHRWGIALQSWLRRDGPLVELSVEIEFLLKWRTSKDNWRSAFRWQVSQNLQSLCPLQEVLHESLKQTSFQQNPELQIEEISGNQAVSKVKNSHWWLPGMTLNRWGCLWWTSFSGCRPQCPAPGSSALATCIFHIDLVDKTSQQSNHLEDCTSSRSISTSDAPSSA